MRGPQLTQAIKFFFSITNKEIEYEAVLLGLKLALALDVAKNDLRCDSQLVVSQIKGEFEDKEDRMIKFFFVAGTFLTSFKHFSISLVPRSENEMADALANFASSVPRACHVDVQVLDAPSTVESQVDLVKEGSPKS